MTRPPIQVEGPYSRRRTGWAFARLVIAAFLFAFVTGSTVAWAFYSAGRQLASLIG